jgi:hypothetical protein
MGMGRMAIHIRRREFVDILGSVAGAWLLAQQARARRLQKLLLGLSIAVAAIGNAEAQQYPSHPITIVVPGAAGGPGDTLARLVAEPMLGSHLGNRSSSKMSVVQTGRGGRISSKLWQSETTQSTRGGSSSKKLGTAR